MTKNVVEETRVSGNRLLSLVECVFNDETKFLVENLDAAVEFCAKKAYRYNGKAKLNVILTFTPSKGKMVIGATMQAKVPEPGALPVQLYPDRVGILHDSDPDQVVMEFPKPTAVSEGGNE